MCACACVRCVLSYDARGFCVRSRASVERLCVSSRERVERARHAPQQLVFKIFAHTQTVLCLPLLLPRSLAGGARVAAACPCGRFYCPQLRARAPRLMPLTNKQIAI